MRVGIIGAGNIGRVHARAVLASADDGVSLAGLFDVDQGRADTLAADLGTRAFASLGELHEAADGIVVASPNRTHAAYACEALAQGRHVLCEKPMATSLAEAADMLRLSSGAAGCPASASTTAICRWCGRSAGGSRRRRSAACSMWPSPSGVPAR